MDRLGKEGKGLIDSVSSLWSVLKNTVHDPEAGPIIIVMDALDECIGSELGHMLHDVKQQCRKSQEDKGKLKYLLTSRRYKQILSMFRSLFDHSSSIRIPGEEE